MSPMFLGGLTARAIKLKDELNKQEISLLESYPAGLVNELSIKEHYKKNIEEFILALRGQVPAFELPTFSNWHQIDALLAWVIGSRYHSGSSKTYGHEQEGLIHI